MSQATEPVSEFKGFLKRPEIIDLYNAVSKLVIDAFLLPRRFHGDAVAVARCESKQMDVFEAAEEVLARGLVKQNIPEDVARYSALSFVSSIVKGLSKSALNDIGRPPPKPPGPGLEWVRIA